MSSLFDDLSDRLRQDPRLSKRGGARFDLSLLLFNARDSLHELWDAAYAQVAADEREDGRPSTRLASAVEELRPIFGDRADDGQMGD